MSEYRWQPRQERGVTQWDASGLPVQLVTLELLAVDRDEDGEPVKRAPLLLWDLHPIEARELAHHLLELAELAERRTWKLRP